MHRRVATITSLAALGVLVGGCTSTASGDATTAGADSPGDTSQSTTSGTITTAQPGQPTVAIPARPKSLSLDGVQPCSLFTDQTQAKLHITRTRPRTTTDVYKAPECAMDASHDNADYTFAARAITSEGIGAWLDGKRVVVAKLVKVGDYPAVTYYPKGVGASTANGGCYTSVDVADGQQLMINITLYSAGALSLEQECQMTEQAASLAVATLQTQR